MASNRSDLSMSMKPRRLLLARSLSMQCAHVEVSTVETVVGSVTDDTAVAVAGLRLVLVDAMSLFAFLVQLGKA